MSGKAGVAPELEAVLAPFERLAVAVSGGVDSMTLAWAAHTILGPAASMFHATSPAVPPEATARVLDHGRQQGWRVQVIDAGEFADPDYLANPVNRCFFCKRDLYGTIRSHWDGPLASGTNLDDLGDFRPGLEAAERHGVRHPFVEAKMDKAAVRALARAAGLHELANLPAAPCLSSRIETGLPVTAGRLALILEVERLLARRLGPGTMRCRVRADGLEVELEPNLLARLGQARGSPALAGEIDALQARLGVALPVRFAAYRRGSAFLHTADP